MAHHGTYRRLLQLLLSAVLAPGAQFLAADSPAPPSTHVTAAKVARVQADFLLMQGKRDEALATLAAAFERGAQMAASGDSETARLDGINVQLTACEGFRILVQNGYETREEYDRVWQVLERIRTSCPVPGPLSGDGAVRAKVAAAEFQIIRMATAARRHFLTVGRFPVDRNDFGPLMPAGVPTDPFSLQPLKWQPVHCAWACCSVGPDGKDNHGTIVYDPGKGTASSGDLVFRVPGLREYPFPRAGTRAATSEGVLKVFPRGLPPDPFSPGHSYGVTDSDPVLIYSIGPDAAPAQTARDYVPSVAYDPTNGVTSTGDLFLQVPR